jgi:hypothetical protein
MRRLLYCCALVAGVSVYSSKAAAETLVFEDNLHAMTNQTSATVAVGGFDGTFTAGPAGARLNENDDAGLGIDNRAVAGSTADTGANRGATKFNIIGGSGPLAGSAEFITFSFDKPGVLQDLFFDGLKDESLEFFELLLPNGNKLTIFDSQTLAKLTDQGFDLADLQVTNPILCQDEEDDLYDLNYRFAAGEVFKLTYGEVDFNSILPGYVPVVDQVPNGARLQGLAVIPEPTSVMLATASLVMVSTCRLIANR